MPAGDRAAVVRLTKNISTYNPLRVAVHEYASIGRDVKAAKSLREGLGRIFMGPGWQPRSAAATTAPVSMETAQFSTEAAR